MLRLWIVFHLFFVHSSAVFLSLFTDLGSARVCEDQVKLDLGIDSYSLQVVFDEGSV